LISHGLREVYHHGWADFTYKRYKFYKDTKLADNQIMSMIKNNPLTTKEHLTETLNEFKKSNS